MTLTTRVRVRAVALTAAAALAVSPISVPSAQAQPLPDLTSLSSELSSDLSVDIDLPDVEQIVALLAFILILLGAVGVANSSEPTGGQSHALSGQTVTRTFTQDGREREFLVRLPIGFNEQRRYPIMLAFDGLNGSANAIRGYSGLEGASFDQAIIVYGTGVANAKGDRYTWAGPRTLVPRLTRTLPMSAPSSMMLLPTIPVTATASTLRVYPTVAAWRYCWPARPPNWWMRSPVWPGRTIIRRSATVRARCPRSLSTALMMA